MELRQLEHFVAVAEVGQFGQAAIRCHISQSALSTSIRSLERELGAPLFFRTTRRVELTEAGRALLDEARRTLEAAFSARESVKEVSGLLRGSLRVGGIPTPGLLDQAVVLANFRQRYPGVDIYYLREASTALVPQVQSSQLDVAFISFPRQLPRGVSGVALMTEPLMFVCRPDHPLADRKRVALKMLAGEEFIGAPVGSIVHRAIDHVFASVGAEPRIPFEVNDVLTNMNFVAAGLGVTIIRESIARSRPDIRAIPLSDKAMTWTLAVATRDHPSRAARAFLDLLAQL
jgi:DNA-binding transcriptional LysR family regulator